MVIGYRYLPGCVPAGQLPPGPGPVPAGHDPPGPGPVPGAPTKVTALLNITCSSFSMCLSFSDKQVECEIMIIFS